LPQADINRLSKQLVKVAANEMRYAISYETSSFCKIRVACSRKFGWFTKNDHPEEAFENKAMRSRQAILLLAIVSLAATVVALALETYFGRAFWLAALGSVFAATGGAAIALSLKKRP
jgi:hypothetical protein